MDSVKGGKLLREIIAKRQRELEGEAQRVESEVYPPRLEDASAVVDLVRRWTAIPASELSE